VRGIEALAAQRPWLSEALRRPGAFLDIGTGGGWLAVEATRSWPAQRVVGLDPWEPALVLARRNLAQSGVADRVELHRSALLCVLNYRIDRQVRITSGPRRAYSRNVHLVK
jgi:methylase of polypeptide subunit release factors